MRIAEKQKIYKELVRGKSIDDICFKFGMTRLEFMRLDKTLPTYCKKDIKEIKEMYLSGVPIDDILREHYISKHKWDKFIVKCCFDPWEKGQRVQTMKKINSGILDEEGDDEDAPLDPWHGAYYFDQDDPIAVKANLWGRVPG